MEVTGSSISRINSNRNDFLFGLLLFCPANDKSKTTATTLSVTGTSRALCVILLYWKVAPFELELPTTHDKWIRFKNQCCTNMSGLKVALLASQDSRLNILKNVLPENVEPQHTEACIFGRLWEGLAYIDICLNMIETGSPEQWSLSF